MAEPTPTTPLSPRSSDVSEYLRDNDFMEGSIALTRPRSSSVSEASLWSKGAKPRRHSKLRHALGIGLLLATVFLWTASNFMSSAIFADSSYSKPYFVTYVNTAFFIIPLIPMFLHHLWADRANPTHRQPILTQWRDFIQRRAGKWTLLRDHESRSSSFSSKSHAESHRAATELLLSSSTPSSSSRDAVDSADSGLTLRATGRLSLEFCLLWFLANYFAAACLEYTTVASSTILSSTSSIWTLICGAALHVERFTLRKCLGVGASLAGVALISTIDVSGETDENRGSFPHKTPHELALGDVMAFVSAVLYGFYAVLMKKRIGDESRVNMPLFFGCVGLFNILLLWPGLIILHLTGVERFELPPTRKIFMIVMMNSASSLVSDYCWAYAVCLTSPLIVTVGLSLTIPLSLIGQIVLDGQYASVWYWVGAVVVVLSFVFVNKEDLNEAEGEGEGKGEGEDGGLLQREGLRNSFQNVRDESGSGSGEVETRRRRSSSIRAERDLERTWRSVHGVVED